MHDTDTRAYKHRDVQTSGHSTDRSAEMHLTADNVGWSFWNNSVLEGAFLFLHRYMWIMDRQAARQRMRETERDKDR